MGKQRLRKAKQLDRQKASQEGETDPKTQVLVPRSSHVNDLIRNCKEQSQHLDQIVLVEYIVIQEIQEEKNTYYFHPSSLQFITNSLIIRVFGQQGSNFDGGLCIQSALLARFSKLILSTQVPSSISSDLAMCLLLKLPPTHALGNKGWEYGMV